MENFFGWGEQFSSLTQIIPNIKEQFVENPQNSWLTVATIIGCIILLIVLVKAKKIEFTPQLISRIGIALALATILKILRLYHFPQGGSITLGSMVPILLIAFMYGPQVGCLTGFIYGVITLIMDPYILHPVQVLFDYPLPFTALGLAGFFRNKKLSSRLCGVGLAVFVRFLCHFISGVAFFGSYAPEGMSPWLYSLSVNGPIIGIEGILCLVIVSVLPIERIIHATDNANSIAI